MSGTAASLDTFTVAKAPGEVSDWQVNFDGVLAVGDTISAINSVVPSPSDLVVNSSVITNGYNNSASLGVGVRLSGGTAGTVYDILINVQTTNGDTFPRTVQLPVQNL